MKKLIALTLALCMILTLAACGSQNTEEGTTTTPETEENYNADITIVISSDTVIFVTNNIEEAVTLGDRVIQFTERPARVKKVYDLSGLGRPRSQVSPEFLRIRQEIAANEELTLE